MRDRWALRGRLPAAQGQVHMHAQVRGRERAPELCTTGFQQPISDLVFECLNCCMGGGALLYTYYFGERSRERISIALTLISWRGGILLVATHKYIPPLLFLCLYRYLSKAYIIFLENSRKNWKKRRKTMVMPMYSSINCQKEATLRNICQGDPWVFGLFTLIDWGLQQPKRAYTEVLDRATLYINCFRKKHIKTCRTLW